MTVCFSHTIKANTKLDLLGTHRAGEYIFKRVALYCPAVQAGDQIVYYVATLSLRSNSPINAESVLKTFCPVLNCLVLEIKDMLGRKDL